MGFLWPDTVPIDPDDGAGSPALDAILRGPAAALTAVALVVGEQARTSDWGPRTAVSLARRWPGPRRVVLADLGLEQPSLHQIAGVENDEGVADVVDFGASLHRVAVAAPGGSFDLLPAGPVAVDADRLRQPESWERVLREAGARHETVLFYVPADAAGIENLVDRAGAVLVLADEAEADSILERLTHPYAVLAVLTPEGRLAATLAAPTTRDAELASGAIEAHSPAEVGQDAIAADLRRRQREAQLAQPYEITVPGAAVEAADADAAPTWPAIVASGTGDVARELRLEAAADDVALDTVPVDVLPPAERPPRRRGRSRHPIGWIVVVVLLMSLLGGAWHFFGNRFFGATPAPAPEPAAEQPAPPPPVPVAAPPADAVPYSVALEAHQNLATALDRVDALNSAQPDLSFHVAPLERGGILYYHVMAGPVPDSGAAALLRDTLLARRLKTAVTPSDIRFAPLALLIGDYSARADAEQQMAELRRLDLPSYVILGLAADSVPLYRVYVGSFAGPAEAEVVRQLLRAAGVRDTLVNRTRSNAP